jgi:thiol-disulfide isomerase/thioredoxin
VVRKVVRMSPGKTMKGAAARPLLVDFVAGVFASGLVIATAPVTRAHEDVGSFVAAAALAFFSTGYVRGAKESDRILATSVAAFAGGLVPVAILNRMGIAFTADLFVILFVPVAFLWCVAGMLARQLVERGRRTRAAVLAGLLVVVLVALAAVALPAYIRVSRIQTTDRAVPPFTVTRLDGRQLGSDELKGRVVVIVFWASWCLPCRAELPEIQRVEEQFRSNPRVTFLAVDTGTVGETAPKARAFLRKNHITLPAAMDDPLPGKPAGPGMAAHSLRLAGIPHVYVLDAEGRVRVIHSGYDGSEELAENLSRAINDVLSGTSE